MEKYGITAEAYLKRCGDRLRDGSITSLFYAAFELRCCVEARLREYMEHHHHYSGVKLRPHNLKESGGRVKKINAGNEIIAVEWHSERGLELRGYHTPIPSELLEFANRLDDYRHAQGTFYTSDDAVWVDMRDELTKSYRQAWYACRGNMPLPPMFNTETNQTHPMVFHLSEGEDENRKRFDGMTGLDLCSLHIEYLNEPPADWVCDL